MVDGRELPGKLMPRDEARRIYEETVRRQKDPALLEYLGQGVFQTSVFPIPGGATRTVEIRYSQLLRKDSGLVDLLLPLGSVKHLSRVIEQFDLQVRIRTNDPIQTLYSPTHALAIERPDNTTAVCRLAMQNVALPSDVRVMYGTVNGAVGMNVVSYRPNPNEDGYFLVLASPRGEASAVQVPKTVLMVCDKSGSMAGEKMEQTKAAARYFLGRLTPADTFNIIAYDSTVSMFRPELQSGDAASIAAANGFVDGLYAGGGTNIHDALVKALSQTSDPNRPTYILFLTDGLPTVGEQNEMRIAASVKQANTVNARIFNFGVGYDVNSRLLDRLSSEQRGSSSYVKPNENIEASVSSLYNRIGNPAMTNLAIHFEFDQPGASPATAVNRTYPRQLPDLFHGEQFVLVGRYQKSGTAKATLTGSVRGENKSFTFPAAFTDRSPDESNGFIEKLWATRRVGEIIDELDLRGSNQELINELVQLSLKHGILTPYTSFLADENVSIRDRKAQNDLTEREAARKLGMVGGKGGFNQRRFKNELLAEQQAGGLAEKLRDVLAKDTTGPDAAPGEARSAPARTAPSFGRNAVYIAESGEAAVAGNVVQLGQKTFYRRNNRWEDADVKAEQVDKARRVKQFSDDYFELANRFGGGLAKYIAFTEPVLVNLGDETWLIEPEEVGP
jgi:Ca-activated chloride channel family protein